jgi:hypothetical protein
MRPVVSLLLGSEGLWIAISLEVSLVAARNQPSTQAGNDFLETLWLAIPLGGIPFTFLTAYLPGGGGWWWLLRVIVASLRLACGWRRSSRPAGSIITIPETPACSARPYTAFNGLLLLLPLTVLAAAVIWKRNRARRR